MADTDLTQGAGLAWGPGKVGVNTIRVNCATNNLADGDIAGLFAVNKGWMLTGLTVYVVTGETSCQLDVGTATDKTTDDATFMSNADISTSGTMLVSDGADGDDPATVKDVFPYIFSADGYINCTMEAAAADSAVLDVTAHLVDLSGSDS